MIRRQMTGVGVPTLLRYIRKEVAQIEIQDTVGKRSDLDIADGHFVACHTYPPCV